MSSLPVYYIETGDMLGLWGWFFNNYLPYGLMWIVVSIVIFAIGYGKNKDLAISGAIMSFFLGIIGEFIPVEARMYYYVFLAMILAVLVIRLFKSSQVVN